MAHGIVGVVDAKRGPRGPHHFTTEKRERAARLLAEGMSIRQVAERLGVTEGTIRYAQRRGDLGSETAAPAGPHGRSERAAQAAGGVAVHRHAERALARLGNCRKPHHASWRWRPCVTAGRLSRCRR